MKTRIRNGAVVSIILGCLLASCWWPVYRQERQTRKDQALISAVKASDTRRVMALLADGASPNARVRAGQPSFGQALRDVLSRLFHPDAPQDPRKSVSALALAVGRKEADTAECSPDEDEAIALLDHGANPNDVVIIDGGVSVSLVSCVCNDHVSLLKRLLDKGADPNLNENNPNLSFITPLMFADAESAQLLLAHGVDVNAQDVLGNTPLMWAIHYDDLDRVRLLLQHGADVTVKNKAGVTALMMGDNPDDQRKLVALLRKHWAK